MKFVNKDEVYLCQYAVKDDLIACLYSNDEIIMEPNTPEVITKLDNILIKNALERDKHVNHFCSKKRYINSICVGSLGSIVAGYTLQRGMNLAALAIFPLWKLGFNMFKAHLEIHLEMKKYHMYLQDCYHSEHSDLAKEIYEIGINDLDDYEYNIIESAHKYFVKQLKKVDKK